MKSIREYIKFHNSFKGRFNRKAYIVLTIKEISLIFLYVCAFIMNVLTLEQLGISKLIIVPFLIILGILFFLVCIIGGVAQVTGWVKRLHDVNLSGYWILLIASLSFVIDLTLKLVEMSIIRIPLLVEIIVILIGLAVFLVSVIYLFFIKGTKGDNRYGPDPLQEGNLRIPKLSKSVLMLLIGLPVIFLFSSLSMFVIKKGFKGGLEEIQKVMGEMQTEVEDRDIKKKQQGELLRMKLEGIIEEDTEDGLEEDVKESMEESIEIEQVE